MPADYEISEFREAHSRMLTVAIIAAKGDHDAQADILTVLAGALGKSVAIFSRGNRQVGAEFLKAALACVSEAAAEAQDSLVPRRSH